MYYFSAIFHKNGFLIFGSNHGNGNGSNGTIGRLGIETRRWTNVGTMVNARNGHQVIWTGAEIMVVGGGGEQKTEKCVESTGRWTCTEQKATLDGYWLYPEMMMVPDDFCKSIPDCS